MVVGPWDPRTTRVVVVVVVVVGPCCHRLLLAGDMEGVALMGRSSLRSISPWGGRRLLEEGRLLRMPTA